MYYTHNLRVKLQEWLNRLLRSTSEQFDSNLKFFFKNLTSQPILIGLLDEALLTFPKADDDVTEAITAINNGEWNLRYFPFDSEAHQAAFSLQFLRKFIGNEHAGSSLVHLLQGTNTNESRSNYLDNYIRPIVTYLDDRLDESSSVLYLLEKYKFRVENFTKAELAARYNAVQSSYEQALEDDLRLYLFDQGIDYPFSTPKSGSGRTDIVGQLDTSDPLILEVKIFDSAREYRKGRVLGGFKQAVKYAEDYNKTVAYIVVFVLDDVQIAVENQQAGREWPVRVEFNGRHYYFVFINLYNATTASSRSPLSAVSIGREELIKAAQE